MGVKDVKKKGKWVKEARGMKGVGTVAMLANKAQKR